MIKIVDVGLGNTGAIRNMFKRLGFEAAIASRPSDLDDADKLILPGVGSFDTGMAKLEERGMIEALNRKALDEKVPVLGICLGMQLLTRSSEEGSARGLGWIEADTVRFRFADDSVKVPHMGWSRVSAVNGSPLTAGFDGGERFYFVHSYHVVADGEANVFLRSEYGGMDFVCGIRRDNVYGVQFHPEKSHRFGKALLSRSAEVA